MAKIEYQRRKVYWVQKMGLGKWGFSVPFAFLASGTYPHKTDVAVNTARSLVECTVNIESVQTSCKSPSSSATLAVYVMSVWNTKAMCFICRKESKGLFIIPLLTRADISILQGNYKYLWYVSVKKNHPY